MSPLPMTQNSLDYEPQNLYLLYAQASWQKLQSQYASRCFFLNAATPEILIPVNLTCKQNSFCFIADFQRQNKRANKTLQAA